MSPWPQGSVRASTLLPRQLGASFASTLFSTWKILCFETQEKAVDSTGRGRAREREVRRCLPVKHERLCRGERCRAPQMQRERDTDGNGTLARCHHRLRSAEQRPCSAVLPAWSTDRASRREHWCGSKTSGCKKCKHETKEIFPPRAYLVLCGDERRLAERLACEPAYIALFLGYTPPFSCLLSFSPLGPLALHLVCDGARHPSCVTVYLVCAVCMSTSLGSPRLLLSLHARAHARKRNEATLEGTASAVWSHAALLARPQHTLTQQCFALLPFLSDSLARFLGRRVKTFLDVAG